MKHSSSSIRSLQSGSRSVFWWDLGSFLTSETPCPFLPHFWEDKIISNADFDLKKKKRWFYFSLYWPYTITLILGIDSQHRAEGRLGAIPFSALCEGQLVLLCRRYPKPRGATRLPCLQADTVCPPWLPCWAHMKGLCLAKADKSAQSSLLRHLGLEKEWGYAGTWSSRG